MFPAVQATENGRPSVGCYPASPSTYASKVADKFTGRAREQSQLDYFGARFVSSAQGRFTSADPQDIAASMIDNPQKLNRYAYVLNNPLAAIDPDGREEIKITVTGFIPQESLRFPPIIGPTYQGDGRTFDPDATSFRIRATVTIETDPSIRSNPLVNYSVGTSGSSVDLYGFATLEARSNVQFELMAHTRDSEGNAIVSFRLSGKDPLTPSQSLTPSAEAHLGFKIPANADEITAAGTVTQFPAFEVYVTRSGVKPVPVLQVAPTNFIMNSVLGLLVRKKVEATKELPRLEDCVILDVCAVE